MIYTVTFNPSLDYVVRVTEFVQGNLHRTQTEDLFVGGKGINVSTVLKELGVVSVALGFVAGFTGNEIIRRLDNMGISSDFIELGQGISRINVKMKSDKEIETEINGQGPMIGQVELELLYEKLRNLQDGDFLVLSGSVPKNMPGFDHAYSEISERTKQANIRLVVDAEGDLLKNTLGGRPFLIKPNLLELEKLFDRALFNEAGVLECAEELQKAGARNVLVSLGEEGAVLLDENGTVHRQTAVKGKVQSSVGAGDSLIAGFLAQLMNISPAQEGYQTKDYEKALKLGVASGSAGAFSIGLPDKIMIRTVYNQMQ
jgi:1-phosphofructokinase